MVTVVVVTGSMNLIIARIVTTHVKVIQKVLQFFSCYKNLNLDHSNVCLSVWLAGWPVCGPLMVKAPILKNGVLRKRGLKFTCLHFFNVFKD